MNSFWNGKRRWLAGLLLLAAIWVTANVPPVLPIIQLPGEKFPEGWDLPVIGRITNTFVGIVVVWILLIILAFYLRRAQPKSGSEVPSGGFYGFFEWMFEGLLSFVESIAGGPHIRVAFGMFMTIFLLVLLSNWWEIVPGVDSFGFIEAHVEEVVVVDEETGARTVVVEPLDGFEIYPSVVGFALNGQCPWIGDEADEEAAVTAIIAAYGDANQAREEALDKVAFEEFKTVHGGESDESENGEPEDGDHEGDESSEDIEGASNGADEVAETAYLDAQTTYLANKTARIASNCYSGITIFAWSDYDPDFDSTAEGASDQIRQMLEVEGNDEETAEDTTDSGDEDSEEVIDETGEEEGVPLHANPSDEEDRKKVPWVVLPFARAPSTDLNFTFALAIISVVTIQIVGVRAQGPGYFTKFFNVKTIFTSPMGGMDLIIGLLELIGEFAKILSFSFRLLGNIFAGSILIFVVSFLLGWLSWAVFIVEFFVGIIQAMIFGMLTAIFINIATQAHGHDDDHEEEH